MILTSTQVPNFTIWLPLNLASTHWILVFVSALVLATVVYMIVHYSGLFQYIFIDLLSFLL